MNKELIPFATDEGKREFVIFLEERENDLNAYIWVNVSWEDDPKRTIRITTIYGLGAYCNHTTDPFCFGPVPYSLLDEAVRRLEACPEKVMKEKTEEFDKQVKRKHQYGAEEEMEYEKKVLKEIRAALKTGTEFMYV